MDSYLQDLAWNCYILFFTHLYHSYGPWFTPKFDFHSISWKPIDKFSPVFIYGFILTRSSLGLLCHFLHIQCKPKFRFRSISWEQIDIFSPFFYGFVLTRSSFGLLHVIITHLYQGYGPWFTAKFHFRSIYWKPTNRISQFFMDSYWQDLALVCNISFFAHLYQSYGPWFTSAHFI